MTMTPRSAAVPPAMIAWSVRSSAGEPSGVNPKVVSSTILARGAAARTRSTTAPTRRSSTAVGTPMSSNPACTITSAGLSRRSPSALSIRAIGPCPPVPALT